MIFDRRAIYTIIIALILIIVGYLWYTDELQFIGQNTHLTKAKVTETSLHHIGKGYYMQTVQYEFEFDKKKYHSEFEVGKILGKQKPDDFIQIKFSTYNPNRSKVIGFYKK